MSEQGNPLAPPATPGPAAPPGLPDAHEGLAKTIGSAHDAASAQLAKLQQAKGMVDHIRKALEDLTKLGDMVSEEDVIEAAGQIVGKGGDPIQLAGLLADLPQGGQGIQAWVQTHAQALAQNEQQLDQQLAIARHGAGSAALHVLAMDHIGRAFGQTPANSNAEGSSAGPSVEEPEESPSNALTP